MTRLVEELNRYFGDGLPLAGLAVLASLAVAVGHACRRRPTAVPGSAGTAVGGTAAGGTRGGDGTAGERWRVAAGIVAVGVAVAVMILTSISRFAPPGGRTVQLLPGRGVLAMAGNPNHSLMVINLAGNIAVFVPLGVLLLLSLARTVPRATAWGAALSLSIEVLQFVGGRRSADVDDVLLNAFGTFLGAALAWSVLAVLRLLRSRRRVPRPVPPR